MFNFLNKTFKQVALAAFLSLLGGSFLYADQVVGASFKGINNNENSLIINPTDAQDAVNVDITPGGKSVKKRPGYGVYKALGSTALHGGVHFYDSTGNDIQVWGSSTSLWGIVADKTPIQIVSSATLASTWDCADIQGSAYCVNSNRDGLIKTDGATLQSWTGVNGTMVESTPDRLAVAGVSGNASTIYLSGSNTFTNFAIAPLGTDPFTEVIAAPGSKLTHLRWGCQKLLWWKDQSFGYFDFDDQYSASVKIVSDTIGTFDNTSAIDPGGNVWFRGQDGHIFEYNCSGLIKQSIEISPFIQASGRRTSNSWTQTSASDFGNGSGYSTFVDTTITPGSIVLSGLRDSFSSLSQWTITSGTWTISSGHAQAITSNPTLQTASMFSVYGGSVAANRAWDMSCQFNRTSAASTEHFDIEFLNGPGNGYSLRSDGDGTVNLVKIVGGSFDSFIISTGAVIIHDTDTHTIELRRSTSGSFSFFVDGSTYNSSVINTAYVDLSTAVLKLSGAPNTINVYNFSLAMTTGTYYSAVNNAPNITAWSTFNPTFQNNDGSHTFYIRSSSNSFLVLTATPAWVAQTANSQVAVIAYPYFQIRDDFAITAATQNPTLNDFTVNWFEGNAVDQVYGIYFDNAIWFSVAYGVGVSSNTYIFKRDLINDGWTVYSFGAGGMLVQNNHLFFGDVSTGGNIFQYGSGTSDNGSSITAYWRTKAYGGQDSFLENAYTNLDSYWARNANQSGTVSYYLNGSTTAVSYTVSLSNTIQSIIRSKKLLPNGVNGSTIDLKFGDTSSTSQWELFLYRLIYSVYPYRPG